MYRGVLSVNKHKVILVLQERFPRRATGRTFEHCRYFCVKRMRRRLSQSSHSESQDSYTHSEVRVGEESSGPERGPLSPSPSVLRDPTIFPE